MSHLFSFVPLRKLQADCHVVGILETLQSRNAVTEDVASQSPFAAFARQHGIPWSLRARGQPATQFIKSCKADVIVVAAFNAILTASELAATRWGGINLHPSLLPHYRGPHPLFWQARHFDLKGGVTVHRIDAGVDTGPIFDQRSLAIKMGEDQRSIFARAADTGSVMLVETLAQLAENHASPRVQEVGSSLFYARRPTLADRQPDWANWPLEHAWHFLRVTQDDFRCIPMTPPQEGRWQVGSMERQGTTLAPGTLKIQGKSAVLVHREGVIHLRRVGAQGTIRRALGRWKRRWIDGEL